MNTQKLRALPYCVLLFPLDIAVAVSLLVTRAAEGLVGALRSNRKRATCPVATAPGTDTSVGPATVPGAVATGHVRDRRPRVTIQILNWDGKHLLADCLPSVIAAVRNAGRHHRIVVVDNGSTDGSVQFVRERFPEVDLLELDRNYGFVEGNDRGIRKTETDIVVLLNNDMIVAPDFLQPLLDGFTDDSVFAVTSQIFFEDASRHRAETGKTRAKFDRGFFSVWHAEIAAADEGRNVLPVFWAGGGSCAIDRLKYLEIGGLDDLYYPFYVEDTDLSYQAWKRGWQCLLAPASHVVHKHRATSGRKFTTDFVDNTIRRNLYLFIWKNVTDLPMLVEHVINLPRIHGRAAVQSGGAFEARAYMRAFLKLPAALVRRLGRAGRCAAGDRDVLARSVQ